MNFTDEITLDTKVKIFSNIDNELFFELANGRIVELRNRGQFKIVRLDDLDHLLSIAPAMLQEGILYIKDREVREFLDIERFYKLGKVVHYENIENILKLTGKELEKTIANASLTAKKEISKVAKKQANLLTVEQVEIIERLTKIRIVDTLVG